MITKGIIHFHDGSTLNYNADDVKYTDIGIYASSKEGRIFVPMSSIKFTAEKS